MRWVAMGWKTIGFYAWGAFSLPVYLDAHGADTQDWFGVLLRMPFILWLVALSLAVYPVKDSKP